MAKKTVLKLLISKYGALSTSLQTALRADQASIDGDGYNYVDNEKESIVDTDDDSADKGKSDKENVIDGDVVDQTPKEPTEAEAPQESPEEPKAGDAPKDEAKATTPEETPKEKLARKIAESKARREAEKNSKE